MSQTTSPMPTARRPDANELKGSAYELFILLVGILSVVNTAIVLMPFRGPVQQVALLVDGIIAPIFLVDFIYRLRTSHPRSDYLWRRFGWADLLSVIPTLGVFRLFRITRVIHLFRKRGLPWVAAELDDTRAWATFLMTVFLTIVVVEFAGMGVYVVESPDPVANIKSASDAIWWGFVTITTVGYGDQYPVTNAGRIIGTFLLFAGIALFSVLTGFIANAFLAPRRRRRFAKVVEPTIAADLNELRTMLAQQEATATEIRARIDRIERWVIAQSEGLSAAQESPGGPPAT